MKSSVIIYLYLARILSRKSHVSMKYENVENIIWIEQIIILCKIYYFQTNDSSLFKNFNDKLIVPI